MKASRGMGDINPDKMPKSKRLAKGGGVNAAGNYTKPSLRKKIVSQVKADLPEWDAYKEKHMVK